MASGTFAIGKPFYWPNAKMPNELLPEWSGMTFLKWNGATFSATTYPKLALIIPNLTLTESRGEFIRTWDDGRGVDAGRALLSAQSSGVPNVKGWFNGRPFSTQTGPGAVTEADDTAVKLTIRGSTAGAVWAPLSVGSGTAPADRIDINLGASSGVYQDGLTEGRPRSIAFNFLVRAA